jgi:O-6-methylguanine DNA methyltransferase
LLLSLLLFLLLLSLLLLSVPVTLAVAFRQILVRSERAKTQKARGKTPENSSPSEQQSMVKARVSAAPSGVVLRPLQFGEKLLRECAARDPAHADAGTAFQRAVWAACACVPAGAVATYAQIAAHAGRPGAQRAVGQALSVNPYAPAIPCHRVVGSSRHLTGFQGVAGCSAKKVALLKQEGVFVDGAGRVAEACMLAC